MAINLVAYSLDELGPDVLREILRGGADIARDAGISIVGGHSIDDAEPKYGLAVTGTVHPERVIRNSTGHAGHDLYLTKPIGGGAVSTAAKRGFAPDTVLAETTRIMTTLNRKSATAALEVGASAMTDVTGFGLLGHLHELTNASGLSAEITADAVPNIEGALDLLRLAEPPIAGGTRRNRDWVEPHVTWATSVAEERRWLLCDAMTSGGLLIAVPPEHQGPGAQIGRLAAGPAGNIHVA